MKPQLGHAAVGSAQDVSREDVTRKALSELQRMHPTWPRWNVVWQTGSSISAVPGQMVLYDPGDGAVQGHLPPARSGDIGKEICFVRTSLSVANYAIRAFPGDEINGAATLTRAEAWTPTWLCCYAPGKWVAYPAEAE